MKPNRLHGAPERGWRPRFDSAGRGADDPHGSDRVPEFDRIEHFEALAKLAEQRVATVEMRSLAVRHEDLAAAAVRIVVARHSQRAARELARSELAAQRLA